MSPFGKYAIYLENPDELVKIIEDMIEYAKAPLKDRIEELESEVEALEDEISALEEELNNA